MGGLALIPTRKYPGIITTATTENGNDPWQMMAARSMTNEITSDIILLQRSKSYAANWQAILNVCNIEWQ